MGLVAWFQELRRRRVIRALLGWGLLSFAVLQVIEPVMHALDLKDWVLKVVVGLLAAGFPVAVVLSWFFDLGPGGVSRTPDAPSVSEDVSGVPVSKGALVGLVLVAAVVGAGVAVFALRWLDRGADVPPSVAVLPFADMSPGKDQGYFADGIAEEILNALAQVKGLKVIGRESSFTFRGKEDDLRTLGEKLGVVNVLEGSVRKDAGRVRVTVKLVRVGDGSQAWSEVYDRTATGIFEVQEEIARAVVVHVAPLLDSAAGPRHGRLPTTTPEAYAQYLLGRQIQARPAGAEDYRRSFAAFERALELDPQYAPAWAGLAVSCYSVFQGSGPDAAEMRDRGRAAAERAVVLAPDLSLGYEARAWFRLADWNWEGARADAERAVALDPGSAGARLRRALVARIVSGDPAAGFQDLELAMSLDPLNTAGWHQVGLRRRLLREPEKAREALRRALEINPDSGSATYELAILELQAGRVAEARRLVAKRLEGPEASKSWRVILAHAEGKERESREVLAEVTQEYGTTRPVTLANLHAWRGEADEAFRWLEKAVAMRAPQLRYARDSFWMESLHADPRWRAMLEKMKLPVD